MKNKSGFTTMELMVVIAIVALLSAIAIPNLMTWREKRTYIASLQQTLAVMHNARLRAVKENVHAIVSFDAETQSFRAFVDNNFDDAWTPETDDLISFYEMPPGVQITSVTFANNSIIFDGRGMPADQDLGGIAELTSDLGPSNAVEVNMTGRIRVTSVNAG